MWANFTTALKDMFKSKKKEAIVPLSSAPKALLLNEPPAVAKPEASPEAVPEASPATPLVVEPVPEVPEVPVVPVVLEVPEVPVVPVVLEVAEVPEAPVVPEVPEAPVVPVVPEVPEVPVVPEVPESVVNEHPEVELEEDSVVEVCAPIALESVNTTIVFEPDLTTVPELEEEAEQVLNRLNEMDEVD